MAGLRHRNTESTGHSRENRTQHRASLLQGLTTGDVQVVDHGEYVHRFTSPLVLSDSGDFSLLERFDDVTLLEVLEVGQADTALES